MTSSRRQFLTGLSTLIAAPAIIKVAGIMPVKAMEPTIVRIGLPHATWRELHVYGRSPAMEVLADLREVNALLRIDLDAASRKYGEICGVPSDHFKDTFYRAPRLGA